MRPEELLQGDLDIANAGPFFDQHLFAAILLGALLVLCYRFARRIVEATVPRALEAQTGDLKGEGVLATELEKRTETLSTLATTLIRVTALLGIVLIVIGVFSLWSLLTVAALFLAAVTLAGQSIVLDYLMGLYIVIEGTFFKGDNIQLDSMKGDVEDVGLRRTVVRAPDGTVYSISNGELRVVSNRTRIYAAAEVKVRGIREEDLDTIVEIAEKVGRELAQDPAYEHDILEPHTLRVMEDNDELGGVAIFRGRVVAARRWAVATAMRRRLNREFLDAGIELNKHGVLARVPRHDPAERPAKRPRDFGRAMDDD